VVEHVAAAGEIEAGVAGQIDGCGPVGGGRQSRWSLRLAAVNLDFGVFVEGAFGAAFGVETNEAGLDAFGVDELAFASFDVFAIGAETQAGRVV